MNENLPSLSQKTATIPIDTLNEREVDKLVAEYIFKQQVEYRSLVKVDGYVLPCDDFAVINGQGEFQEHVGFYTRMLSDTWLIVEHLGVSFICGYYAALQEETSPLCYASFAALPEQRASSLPFAIIKAAFFLLNIIDQQGNLLLSSSSPPPLSHFHITLREEQEKKKEEEEVSPREEPQEEKTAFQ